MEGLQAPFLFLSIFLRSLCIYGIQFVKTDKSKGYKKVYSYFPSLSSGVIMALAIIVHPLSFGFSKFGGGKSKCLVH